MCVIYGAPVLPSAKRDPMQNISLKPSKTGFFMPVARDNVFKQPLEEAITTFLDAGHRDHYGHRIVAVRSDYFVTPGDTDHIIRDMAVQLHARREDGRVVNADIDELPETTLAAFKDILYAYHCDDAAPFALSGPLLPWRNPALQDAMAGHYRSIHAARHFKLVSAEYLPSWIENRGKFLKGSAASRDERRAACTMVLPHWASAHEEINERARWPEMEAFAGEIYRYLLEHVEYDNLHFEAVDFSAIDIIQ
jgi:hypothetical protein